MRSGRSLVGTGRFSRGHRSKMSCRLKGLDGNPPVSVTVVATTGIEVVSKSSAAAFCGARDIHLQTSAQDEQSRLPEDPVRSGSLSGDLLGHLSGHPSGQPGESFSVCWAGTQHSTRTPARQSEGSPTSPQIATSSVRVRIDTFYIDTRDRSKIICTTCGAPIAHSPIIRVTRA